MEELSREYLLGLAEINPEYHELTKDTPEVEDLNINTDIVAYRAQNAALKATYLAAYPPDLLPIPSVEEDVQIPVRDGTTITIRIHRPTQSPPDGSPVFVVYHGGGFALGDLDSEAVLCRQWTALGGVAVNVGYRLAPEHAFPGPVNDAFDALKWELRGDAAKGFLVGGVSAGGNFAAVVAHLYRDEGVGPPLTGVYLSVPSVCAPEAMPEKYSEFYFSREQNKDAPVLNAASLELFAKLYDADPNSPLRSPLLFPSHKGLPPTYFQICGMDPLRDEAIIYEKVLREECGIETKVDMYPGLPHWFWAALPKAEFAKKMRLDSVEGLKWLLERR